jgi:tetratricopeptide (TPR) repeat protein
LGSEYSEKELKMMGKRTKVIMVLGVALLSVSAFFFVTRNISFNISLDVNNKSLKNGTEIVLLGNNTNNFQNYKNTGLEYKQKALQESNRSQQIYYWNEAINSWKEAIELNQNDTIVLNEMGYGYYYLMNLTQNNNEAMTYFNIGIDYFNRVLNIDTNFYWALFGIGVLYADIAERTSETIDYLRESIKYLDRGLIYNGDYDWIHSSKGWSYYKLGNLTKETQYYSLAINEFNLVLALDRNNQNAMNGIRYCTDMLN